MSTYDTLMLLARRAHVTSQRLSRQSDLWRHADVYAAGRGFAILVTPRLLEGRAARKRQLAFGHMPLSGFSLSAAGPLPSDYRTRWDILRGAFYRQLYAFSLFSSRHFIYLCSRRMIFGLRFLMRSRDDDWD